MFLTNNKNVQIYNKIVFRIMNLAVILIIVFILAYVLIAMENRLNINKSSVALLLCCVMWSLLSLFSTSINPSLDHARISSDLLGALGSTCEILVFLIGAMTIVDIIDTHGGFEVITKHITTRRKTRLLWLLATITFLMSSVLDNMTTTIVMVMLLRRMITNYKERWLFASIIVIAANCGGAWSPIGDVSTILLWMKGNVTSLDYIPVAIAARFLKGVIVEQQTNEEAAFRPAYISGRESRTILILGVVLLILVPVFKSVVGLPPYVGVMFALAIMWIYTDMMYKKKKEVAESLKNRVSKIIKQLDMPTVLFLLGILMSVSALGTAGVLSTMAEGLNEGVHNAYAISTIIGLLSSVVDNSALVAASMGMFPIPDAAALAASADPAYLSNFLVDGTFWHMLAYCAGTGGSIIIIGSSAGVVAMGLENINIIWYFKHVSLLALLGYFAGIAVYILQHFLVSLI